MSEKEYIEIESGVFYDCEEEFQAFDLPADEPLQQDDKTEVPDNVRDPRESQQSAND